MTTSTLVENSKRALGIDRLVLQIHDASFPSLPEEDIGRGSPYSLGAERLCAFARELGFDAIQLGPQGMTDRGNPSPYDGTLFSRNPLNLPWSRLVKQGRLSAATLAAMCRSAAQLTSVTHAAVHDIAQKGINEILAKAESMDWAAAREFLAENEAWLVPDALYQCLCREHGAGWWGEWSRTEQGAFDQDLFCPAPNVAGLANQRLQALRSQYAQDVEHYAFLQWLLASEHRAMRQRLDSLGLRLYADLQVGLAPQDVWSHRGVFLNEYRMGAPPSRTNPDGQPWGYSVLDPAKLGTLSQAGPALAFVRARLEKVFTECDGVRIDHPHGWVDPWVYRTDDPDPFHAVQNGGRLFSSPDLLTHPQLAVFAIARTDQIDGAETPYADHRVRSLDDDQVARYAILVDTIIERSRSHGPLAGPVACEVLSTLPYTVQRVMERHGLGRFRVIQKAKLDDPADVYRIEHAQPADWIMLGTHDTATVWELAEGWCQDERAQRWAQYLAPQLAEPEQRTALAAQIAAGPGELVHAMFAAMLASQARHVSVFFPDLFGMTDRYNRPGVISGENWQLRLPHDFEAFYEERRQRGAALDLSRCLQMALR